MYAIRTYVFDMAMCHSRDDGHALVQYDPNISIECTYVYVFLEIVYLIFFVLKHATNKINIQKQAEAAN